MATTHDAISQSEMTPAGALDALLQGNRRYVANQRANRDFAAQRAATTGGQWPYAAVLSCIDSRASAELLFDAGIGDLFSVRIAGNCVDDDVIGSIEFACKVAGSKLVMVLGHTSCGAVKGACDRVEMGHLTTLLSKILPAVDKVAAVDPKPHDSSNPDFVQHVATCNVELGVAALRERSPILREMEAEGAIRLVGAMYDIATGEVSLVD